MLISEFTLDHPILREALSANPETRIVWERTDVVDGDQIVLFWAEGGEFETFETAMERDPTITTPTVVTEIRDRRLYKTNLAGEGREKTVYPTIVEQGGVIQRLRASRAGWEFRVVFPDRDAFRAFQAFCDDCDVRFSLSRLFVEEGAGGYDDDLTDRQRELLAVAVDAGYFEIPREASLADLADRLDISSNAASERLRRALGTLAVDVVDEGDGTVDG